MYIETKTVEVPWGITDGGLLNGFQKAEPSARKIAGIIEDMGREGYVLTSREVDRPFKLPGLGTPFAVTKTVLIFQRYAG